MYVSQSKQVVLKAYPEDAVTEVIKGSAEMS